MKLIGKVSNFGGPQDMGVSPSEGLAFIYSVDDAPELFLPKQPPGTTGLARRLNPETHYIAMRFDYDKTSKEELLDRRVIVRAPATGKQFLARPADWGPAGPESDHDTGRIADISPGLMDALGIETDDTVEVIYRDEENSESDMQVVISSGHSLLVRGASGVLDEVDEARKVVSTVVRIIRQLGGSAVEFHDDTSTTQQKNLETICKFHNSQTRELDVSVHFNAYAETEKPMGVECLFVSQKSLATDMAEAISVAGGFINRGPKHNTGLYFLNHTDEPAILIEVCFVDSSADAKLYKENFWPICVAIAGTIIDTELVA